MRSPVKYSKWYQPEEPDRDTPNPVIVIGSLLGMLAAVFGVLALIGARL
jgi:hypothetical protein